MSLIKTRVVAEYMGDWDQRVEDLWALGETYELVVHSNPFGALQFKLPRLFGGQKSITVVDIWHPAKTRSYQTITDFLWAWEINWAETRTIRVPFLRRSIGFGFVFELVAERFPLRFKMLFNGCSDRRTWYNHCVRFVPLRHEERV
jgi:hypothetical protein